MLGQPPIPIQVPKEHVESWFTQAIEVIPKGVQRGMIASYELEQFYPTIDIINKLGSILNINILCRDSYSNFLLNTPIFKNNIYNWRLENNLTKRS